MNNKVFEEYSISRAMAVMAVPTVLSMLVTIFYNMADTFFVGQTGDANQVAAVSIATPVFLMIMAIGNIFGIGGSSYISRLLGEGNHEKTKNVSSFCFYGSIIAGIVVMLIMLLGMETILKLIGSSVNTVDYTRDYLAYISYGAVFVVISTTFGNVVRSEGAAKTAMVGMMLGTIVNIILDPIMILNMNMGVKGAAIATVIGNICSTLFYVIYLISKRTNLSINPKYFKCGVGIFTGVFAIGLPASINNVLMSTSNIVMNNFLAGYGDNAVAGMGVAMKANMLVVLIQIGLGMGIQPLIGYCYGSRNIERLRRFIRGGIICNVVFGTIITTVYFVFTKQIINIFIKDQGVIDYGIDMLRALMIVGPFIGIMFIFNFSFQAMGKAVPSLILSLSRQGLVFIPVLFIANRLVGLRGIVYAQPIADAVSLIMAFIMFVIIRNNLEKSIEQDIAKEGSIQ